MIKRVSFLGMSKDEWDEQRRKTIGGSDAGTVVGLNSYSSPYELWAIKTGKIMPDDISEKESVRLGHDLEDYVARRWMEKTGKKLRRDNHFVYNTEYPFAHVQADRLVVNENAGFEAKTSSSYDVIKLLRDGKYRDSWYVQCVHGMMVTGAERWYLGVLCFGHGFFDFTIERDEAEISALSKAEAEFWECVQDDVPPPVDGAPATSDTLTTIWRDSDGGEIPLIGRVPMLDEYFYLREQKKAIDERISAIENVIKEDMESAERANEGKYTVSWKSQTRSLFQAKEFAKAYPDVDLTPFYKTTTTRPFKVTIKEEKEA